jgi:hypothetical protein
MNTGNSLIFSSPGSADIHPHLAVFPSAFHFVREVETHEQVAWENH